MSIPNELAKDYHDIEVRRIIIKEYGDSNMPYSGVNQYGEDVELHVSYDGIVLKTYQDNGWVRINYYDSDGHNDGETFDGKWNKQA